MSLKHSASELSFTIGFTRFFLTCSYIQYYYVCRSALQTLSEQHFPQLSTELHSGSLEYSGFVYAFRKILQGLEESGSCVILLSVVAMSASESQHVCEDRIQQSLQTFIKRYCQAISINSHHNLNITNLYGHINIIY